MSLDKEQVRNIARLARLDVPEAELHSLVGELSNILHFVEQLGEVNTDGVLPVSSVVNTEMPKRSDLVTDGGYPNDILANAPESFDGFFLVPKVVE